jgi:cysteine sulfinate desulfinase/cysteine desulfurase-like protein
MLSATEQYVVDAEGNRVGVVLDIAEYQRILEELEELEALRAYDAAQAAGDEAVPFEQAVVEIARDRPHR